MCFAVAMIISDAALWGVEEKTSDYKVDNLSGQLSKCSSSTCCLNKMILELSESDIKSKVVNSYRM